MKQKNIYKIKKIPKKGFFLILYYTSRKVIDKKCFYGAHCTPLRNVKQIRRGQLKLTIELLKSMKEILHKDSKCYIINYIWGCVRFRQIL